MSNIYIHTLNHLGVRFIAYKIETDIMKVVEVDVLKNIDVSEEMIEYIINLIRKYNFNDCNLYFNSYFVNKSNNLRDRWAKTEIGKEFLDLLKYRNITLYDIKVNTAIKKLLQHRIIEKYNKSNKNELVSYRFFGEKQNIEDYSFSVNILIRGIADYTDENKKGYSIAILNARNSFRELYFEDTNTTGNRMLLIATINAVKQLKEPCIINIYTHTLLGFSGGSTNADLKNELKEVLEQGNHCINEIVGSVYQNYLNSIIENYFSPENKDLV